MSDIKTSTELFIDFCKNNGADDDVLLRSDDTPYSISFHEKPMDEVCSIVKSGLDKFNLQSLHDARSIGARAQIGRGVFAEKLTDGVTDGVCVKFEAPELFS
ncbi:MAG: hypothetical protein ACRBDI_07330 [Alphaproteobacteria bacterium]